jgi:hypothetical protein
MKTKNIFKALAMAMLMPTMLLTTACSNDDDVVVNNETTNKKGYPLQVTVNVSRQGDDATRAEYNESTKKLSFSEGDKLFVEGSHAVADRFAGTLTWQSGGTFSGTIYTESPYEGTIDDLLNGSYATLLPAGYESYDYLEIIEDENEYEDHLGESANNSFATSKKLAVEQLSYETGSYTSGTGFVLEPRNAILNFTITGLTGNKSVDVSYSAGMLTNIEGSVTTDGDGTATFAIGVEDGTDLADFTLTVDGIAITTVTSSKTVAAGKIYNITRSAAPAPAATSLSELKTAINGGTDCSSYIGWEVNSAGAIAESSVSGTKIGYVAYVSTSDVDAGVSGSRILVIASADASATTPTWGSYGTARGLTADDLNGYSNTNTLQGYGSEAHPAAYAAWNYSAAIPSGGATPAHWFMPTKKQWKNMRDAKGGTYGAMSTAYGISGHYWTSTEVSNNNAWRFVTNSNIQSNMKSNNYYVRSIFAY